MEQDDVLCLELLMNNSKKRCLKNSNLSSKDNDTDTDKNIRSGVESIVNVIYEDISNDSFILSNFDVFLNRLINEIKRYIKTFEKEYNGKQA